MGSLPTALGGMQQSVRSSSHRLEYQRSKEARRLAEGVSPEDLQLDQYVVSNESPYVPSHQAPTHLSFLPVVSTRT